MEGNQSNTKDLGSMTIKDIFFKYIRYLPVFLVSVAFCLLAAYLYLRYTTPIYRVGGTITFKMEENTRGGKLDDIFMAKSVNDVQSEIEILKSRSLMERVVDSAKLQTNYYAVGKIKSLNIYKGAPFRLEIIKQTDSLTPFRLDVIFESDNEFRINKENQLFKFGDLFQNVYGIFRLKKVIGGNSGKEYFVEWKPAAYLAATYAPMVRVAPKIVGTNIHNIQFDYPNSQLAADIINTLMSEYLKASIEEKNITINQRLMYIEGQLNNFKKDLDSIENRLITYKKANDLTDIEEQSSNYFGMMKEADEAISKQRLQLKVADMLEDYLQDANYNFELVPSSLGLADATLNGQVTAYNTLQFERKTMLEKKIPETNIQILAKNEEIEKARKNILESLENVKKLYQLTIDDFYKRGNLAQSKMDQIPEKAQRLLEIERERDSKLALFKFLLEQREETAMSQAATTSNSKILELAQPTNSPIKPNRKGIQLLAIILGIGIPAMFIFFQEIVNDKVNTRFDIEKITSVPVLGEVGHSYSSSSMIVSKTNRSMVSEQFRIIRSNLQYILNKVEKPVIMLTSSYSAEGKSFIATNLGGVMALAGKKTVMLEFDIRKPKLFSGLKLTSKVGITNFLVGKSPLEDLPIKVPGFDNLYAISCGPVPPNPSELLLDSRVEELFVWLRENFDVIIMDTAPVGMVSDAMTLGKFADATMYVVRQGYTYKKQISLIDEFYHENRLPKVSIIVNDIKIKPGYGYYGYGRYGYGYGYGGGYYETEEGTDVPNSKKVAGFFKNLFKRNKT
jgi:tyrosine-protein kinase Etk/Wzc